MVIDQSLKWQEKHSTPISVRSKARCWNLGNVLVMSLRATSTEVAEEILDAWYSEAVKEDEKATIAQLQDIEARHTPKSSPGVSEGLGVD